MSLEEGLKITYTYYKIEFYIVKFTIFIPGLCILLAYSREPVVTKNVRVAVSAWNAEKKLPGLKTLDKIFCLAVPAGQGIN